MARFERSPLITYEELRAEPHLLLRRVMEFVGEEVSDTVTAAAVEFASFDKLKQREAERFFKSAWLQPGNDTSSDSFKVRRGKVGGYRDYFTAEQIEKMDDMVRTRLAPSYGYGKPGDTEPAAAIRTT